MVEKFVKGPLVAIVAIALIAILGVAAVLVFKPADGAATSADVIAVLGLVLSPIVAIASAYYGIAVSGASAAAANDNVEKLTSLVDRLAPATR